MTLMRRGALRLLGLVLVVCAPCLAAAAGPEAAQDDVVIARSLAQLLQDARMVISNNQDLINNREIGDKHLTGEAVLDQAIKSYIAATGVDPRTIDPASRQGRLLRALMAAIVQVTDDNQASINVKGMGFKAFIPAVFARLVDEAFAQKAKGEAVIKVTAPPELIRNRKARPDAWEAKIIADKLLDANWPKGEAYAAMADVGGRPSYRFMVPEYYSSSCLVCHGSPKGEMDITGYPKEGGKLNDLGGVVSITLFR
jgi:hypothetical protein